MITYFQNHFALSEKGAKDLLRGIVSSTLLNLALMLPPAYLFLFLMDNITSATPSAGASQLWFYLLLAAILAVVMFLVARWQYNSTYTAIYAESAQRRIDMAEKMRRLPLSFFGDRNLSDLTSAVMEDCTMLERIFSHAVPQLFASASSVVILAVGMFCYDWRLAVSLFWVVPPSIATLLLFRNRLRKLAQSGYAEKRDVTEQVQEGLECIQEIKAHNGEEDFSRSFNQKLKSYEKGLVSHELLAGSSVNLSAIMLKLGMPSVMLLGAWLLQHDQVTMFTYLAFLIASSVVYNPILDVANNLAILNFLDVRIDRVKEISGMPMQKGRRECKVNHYDIAFRNVHFAYDAGRAEVLRGVSFVARQGEITALVGPSGSGKSTAAKLSARFWDVCEGQILLGGMDISQIDPEVLLENFAIVFQDVLLFNTTLADNIRIGKRNATDDEVRRAATLAQCDEFISRMPQGYDTILGENGATLSGGERQRISIARALLKDAPIILLDEATASLDAENETKIQAGISRLVQGKTVIIIAHRMRTVRHADHIVVLNGGRVSEQGTPDALMKKNGEFAKMVAMQQGGNE